ncbi:MAG: hypothetical protein AB1547_06615 [Thermodesulfobacteriota bacterium]
MEQAQFKAEEAFKRVKEIKTLQRELIDKDDSGRPRICLFDKEPLCTRKKFFQRLGLLFEDANRQNKKWISDVLQECDSMLRADQPDFNNIRRKLENVQKHWYEVPKQDEDKNALIQHINDLFEVVKSPTDSLSQMDPLLTEIRQYFQEARDLLSRLPTAESLVPTAYFSCIIAMKEVHDRLKKIQQLIKQAHDRLKSIQARDKTDLYNTLKDHYQSLQLQWHDDRLIRISNWCETLSAENYSRIARRVEELENRAESVSGKEDIKKLNADIKQLEADMGEKDSGGFYLLPMKRDQLEELYARTRSLKIRMQTIWGGLVATQSTDRNRYQEYEREMKSLYSRLDQVQSKSELFALQRGIQQLHEIRRKDLGEGNITPKTSARIIHELQTLWGEVNQKFETFSPIEFSITWLMETYERNRQNNWVIFVDEVPNGV